MILVISCALLGLAGLTVAFGYRLARGRGEASRLLALHGVFGVGAFAAAGLGAALNDARIVMLGLILAIVGFVMVRLLANEALARLTVQEARDA